jgi:hypothetical protein
MKKLVPLITVIGAATVAAAKLLLAKQYCLLCFIKGYEALAAAPSYFTDSFVTVLPSLF